MHQMLVPSWCYVNKLNIWSEGTMFSPVDWNFNYISLSSWIAQFMVVAWIKAFMFSQCSKYVHSLAAFSSLHLIASYSGPSTSLEKENLIDSLRLYYNLTSEAWSHSEPWRPGRGCQIWPGGTLQIWTGSCTEQTSWSPADWTPASCSPRGSGSCPH